MFKGKMIFSLMVFLISLLPQSVYSAKLRPPVQVTFQQNNLSSDETEITLTAQVHVDTESLRLFIDLPLEIVLIDGELEWEGRLQAGDKQEIKIRTVRSSGVNPVIGGKATIRLKNGVEFVQKNQLTLNDLRQDRSLAGPPAHREGNQRSIFDFRK